MSSLQFIRDCPGVRKTQETIQTVFREGLGIVESLQLTIVLCVCVDGFCGERDNLFSC